MPNGPTTSNYKPPLDLQTATNKCNGRLWPRPVLGKRRRNRIWVVLVRCLKEGKGKTTASKTATTASRDRKQSRASKAPSAEAAKTCYEMPKVC